MPNTSFAARPDVMLLLYLRTYIEEHGFAPSVREIGEVLNLAPSTVHKRLRLLADSGWIERIGPRAIRIVQDA